MAQAFNFDGLDNLLILDEAGMGVMLRRCQAIDAEVAVVGFVSEVTAVSEELNVILVFRANAVVGPFPHTAANQALVGVDRVPVFLEVAGAVAHGVGVFAHEVWAVVDCLHGLFHQRIHCGVHAADHVQFLRIVAVLIVHRAGEVAGLDPANHCAVVAAPAAFIAQRPDDNGGMVAVAAHHALHAVHIGQLPLRVVAQIVGLADGPCAVGLQIGLVYNVQAELIA